MIDPDDGPDDGPGWLDRLHERHLATTWAPDPHGPRHDHLTAHPYTSVPGYVRVGARWSKKLGTYFVRTWVPRP